VIGMIPISFSRKCFGVATSSDFVACGMQGFKGRHGKSRRAHEDDLKRLVHFRESSF
jgi:hypothetical protein